MPLILLRTRWPTATCWWSTYRYGFGQLMSFITPINLRFLPSNPVIVSSLMLDHQDKINRALQPLQFIGFSRMPRNHNDVVVENTLSLYTTFEMLTVLFGFIIFMGAITGVACVCTGRKRYVWRRRWRWWWRIDC